MRLRQLQVRYEHLAPSGASWVLFQPPPLAPTEWRPPTDLYETPAEYIIRVELAGLSEDDFEVLLYEDSLVIRGQRSWRPPEDAVLHAAEIRCGPFQVALELPSLVDRARIRGRYEAGFLIVTLPRRGLAP